jgi:hypothetical protein
MYRVRREEGSLAINFFPLDSNVPVVCRLKLLKPDTLIQVFGGNSSLTADASSSFSTCREA